MIMRLLHIFNVLLMARR